MATAARSEHVLHQSDIRFAAYHVENEGEKDLRLRDLLRERGGRTIVYCATANAVDFVHRYLLSQGINAVRDHRRLRKSEKLNAVASFLKDANAVFLLCGEIPAALAGVKIDRVVHFNFPLSLNEYIRETAPVAEGGECVLLYLRKDKRTQKRDQEELRQVIVYAQSAMCRTKLLSRHMGNMLGADCGRCDNCLHLPKHAPLMERTRIDLDALLSV